MFILAEIRRNFQIFIFLYFFFVVLVWSRSEISQRCLPRGWERGHPLSKACPLSEAPPPPQCLGSPPAASWVLAGGGGQWPASWVEGSVLSWWWNRGASRVTAWGQGLQALPLPSCLRVAPDWAPGEGREGQPHPHTPLIYANLEHVRSRVFFLFLTTSAVSIYRHQDTCLRLCWEERRRVC